MDQKWGKQTSQSHLILEWVDIQSAGRREPRVGVVRSKKLYKSNNLFISQNSIGITQDSWLLHSIKDGNIEQWSSIYCFYCSSCLSIDKVYLFTVVSREWVSIITCPLSLYPCSDPSLCVGIVGCIGQTSCSLPLSIRHGNSVQTMQTLNPLHRTNKWELEQTNSLQLTFCANNHHHIYLLVYSLYPIYVSSFKDQD